MSKLSIFASLFILFELYVIITTANEISYNVFVDVNVYYPAFQCGYYLQQSLNMLFESLSLPIVDKCIGVEYINNGLTFYQSQQCVKIIDKNQYNIKAEHELQELLEQISKFISIFNGAFSNCTITVNQQDQKITGQKKMFLLIYYGMDKFVLVLRPPVVLHPKCLGS